MMGTGASKQIDPSDSVVSFDDSRTHSSIEKKQEVQDEDEKAMEEHEAYLKNMYMLKRMFKQLDPAVMKTTTDVEGEIKVALKYLSDKSMLLVKVIAAQDLLAKDVRGHTSDPYVKVELLLNKEAAPGPSTDQSTVKCTAVSRNTRNPIFNEIFTFTVAPEDKEIAQLRCSVWSYDGMGRDDFLGERIVNVGEVECDDVIHADWYHLRPEVRFQASSLGKALLHNLRPDTQCIIAKNGEFLVACAEFDQLRKRVDLSIGGEISISLNYKLPQTFNVEILEGRKLLMKKNVKPFVRVYIPGVPYVYKTTPLKSDTEAAVWNENFDFPVPKEELKSRYVVLVLLDDSDSNAYLGECHIDLANFQVEVGFSGSFELSDMRGNVAVRSRWTRNAMTQEFNEALQAHALYKRPQFLFGRLRGATDTAITVRVPKAGTQSRLRVVNGVLVH